MIKNFHHIAISVTDIERSIAFYRDVLEMDQLSPVFPLNGEQYDAVLALKDVQARMCVMQKNGFYLELFEFAQPSPAPKDPNYSVADRGLTHFGVEVEDIDATYEKMVSAGVTFHSSIRQFPGGMKAAYGRDPDGNVFEILERH